MKTIVFLGTKLKIFVLLSIIDTMRINTIEIIYICCLNLNVTVNTNSISTKCL